MSGKLSRLHKLVSIIDTASKELNEIAKQIPICSKCGGVELEDRGYLYKCKGCKTNTPRITAEYTWWIKDI